MLLIYSSGFDMGGTSTDVSRYGGRYEHVFETTTAGVTIQSPQLDINTVAAGGGSRLFFRNGLFVVGPESAGAHPGPGCYRKGGPATVTDANLFLGRLLPDFFPKIFGKNENEGLDVQASEKLLQELAEQINKENGKNMSADEVAYGFLTVANETMTRPIRSLTEAKGHDTSKHRLATFGGAGGKPQLLGVLFSVWRLFKVYKIPNGSWKIRLITPLEKYMLTSISCEQASTRWPLQNVSVSVRS
jgi:5-oxoprolinase (ATP-hydrolysing)